MNPPNIKLAPAGSVNVSAHAMTDPFDRTYADWKREERRAQIQQEREKIRKEIARRELWTLLSIAGAILIAGFLTWTALSDFYTHTQKERIWHSKLKHPQR